MKVKDYLPGNFLDTIDKDSYICKIKLYKFVTHIKLSFTRNYTAESIDMALSELLDGYEKVEDVISSPKTITLVVKHIYLPKNEQEQQRKADEDIDFLKANYEI